MKALILKAHGGIENFRVKNVDLPKPAAGQVLVRIYAASLNQIDNKIRGGLPIGPDLPGILGSDFAGTIESIGEGVFGFRTGDSPLRTNTRMQSSRPFNRTRHLQ